MRADNSRVGSFDREHCVAHRSYYRVSDRSDASYDAYRFCYEYESFLFIAPDYPCALFAFHVVPDDPGLAHVLFDLVLIHAHLRLVDRHPGEDFGVVVYGLSDDHAKLIDSFLIVPLDDLLRSARSFDHLIHEFPFIHIINLHLQIFQTAAPCDNECKILPVTRIACASSLTGNNTIISESAHFYKLPTNRVWKAISAYCFYEPAVVK